MFTKFASKVKTLERNLGATLGADISTPRSRRRAWWHFHLLDHGILRTFWKNYFAVAPEVWRSNQPSPRRLRWFKKQGIATVLNLRGENQRSPYLFERETCDTIGLGLVSYPMQARHLDAPEHLIGLLEIFETIQHPFVMHCKSGADRAGLASALYLMHIKNTPVKEAKKQLGLKFIHVKSFQTGILDYLLDACEVDIETTPMPIRQWLETRYDPVRLTAQFNATRDK